MHYFACAKFESIIYQTNKITGITYAYSNEAYWDKEKQQSRAKRVLIGKVDPVTGEIIATREYRKPQVPKQTEIVKPGPVPMSKMQRSFYGASYLLNEIGKETGVEADLKACFPDTYKKILSIAYYLILETNNSLSRFTHWQKLHIHPYGDDIPSQRSSELFQSIDEKERMAFFQNRESVALKKNTALLMSQRFPATPRFLSKSRMARTKKMIGYRK